MGRPGLFKQRLQAQAARQDQRDPSPMGLPCLAQPAQERVRVLLPLRSHTSHLVLQQTVYEYRHLVDREQDWAATFRQGSQDRVTSLRPIPGIDLGPEFHLQIRNRQFLDPTAGASNQVGKAGLDPVPRRTHGLRLNSDFGNRIGRIGGGLQIDENHLELSRFSETALQFSHEARLAHAALRGQQGVGSLTHPLFQRFELRLAVEEVLSVDPVAPALSDHSHPPTILLATISLATILLSS